MVWITLRIARIRHPVKGKPDDLTRSSDCLELVPILSRCLFGSRRNPEVKIAALRSLVFAA